MFIYLALLTFNGLHTYEYRVYSDYIYIIRSAFMYFSVNRGGGGEAANLVYGSLPSSLMAFYVFYSDE